MEFVKVPGPTGSFGFRDSPNCKHCVTKLHTKGAEQVA